MFATRIQLEDFDPTRETAVLVGPGVGAMVTFVGYCRDEGGRLSGLELEHYPDMAEEEIRAVVHDAAARWSLLGAVVVHRYGLISVGEQIVLVAAAAAHRAAAFAAAEFVMDHLKMNAPFWKRERRADGSFGAWVSPKEGDAAAVEKWSNP
jgi:molybdopterin synthase catalytic subunit